MGGVVALDEVQEDGAGFPDRDVGVWVDEGGDAAVGVHGEVFGGLDVGHFGGGEFIGDRELVEEHGDFGRIGAAVAVEEEGFDLGGHCYFLW